MRKFRETKRKKNLSEIGVGECGMRVIAIFSHTKSALKSTFKLIVFIFNILRNIKIYGRPK